MLKAVSVTIVLTYNVQSKNRAEHLIVPFGTFMIGIGRILTTLRLVVSSMV